MIVIPAILEGYRSLKDKSIKICFETNEPNPDQALLIHSNLQQFGYLAFKNEPFSQVEKETIDALKTDFEETGKTPSQRLRAVLYRTFEQDKEGYSDFDSYYKFKMEKFIKHIKTKLPQY